MGLGGGGCPPLGRLPLSVSNTSSNQKMGSKNVWEYFKI